MRIKTTRNTKRHEIPRVTYLPQDKVILDNPLNLFVGPYIPVENLAAKLLRILDIDEQPAVQILGMVASFHERAQKEDIARRSEQVFQTFGFPLGNLFHTVHSARHLLLLSFCKIMLTP